MSTGSDYRALPAPARARLAEAGARAAFLVSESLPKWEKDEATRQYWTERLLSVFDNVGVDRKVELLAHAAFKRFGYVVEWESSPKAQDAWKRRMRAAIEAIQNGLAIEIIRQQAAEGEAAAEAAETPDPRLEKIHRNIRESERHVAEQQARIVLLEMRGERAESAKELLQTFSQLLELHRQHLAQASSLTMPPVEAPSH